MIYLIYWYIRGVTMLITQMKSLLLRLLVFMNRVQGPRFRPCNPWVALSQPQPNAGVLLDKLAIILPGMYKRRRRFWPLD